MIINMLMTIINTHPLTCIQVYEFVSVYVCMCAHTIFMQQSFGLGGDSGY